MTADYFNRDRTKLDGYNNYCKKCRSLPKDFFHKEGMKRCRICNQYLPSTTEFFWKRHTKDNLSGTCKVCSRDEQLLLAPTKICTICKEELPNTTEFFNSNIWDTHGLHKVCRECRKKYGIENKEVITEKKRAYSAQNRKSLAERSREKYNSDAHKLRVRERNIRNTYSISLDELRELMDKQKGCCDICGDSLAHPDSVNSYSIDHNHSSGKVRGLLCCHCNSAIGYVREDEKIIENLVKYLRKHNG